MSGEFWFIVYMSLAPLTGVLVLAILVMHFLMPKTIIETYFKPPYFKPAECALFSGFPYAPMRTVMFMRVLGFPDSGKVRGLTEAHILAPTWYRKASKVVVLMAILLFISMLLISAGFGIYFVFEGE